VVCVDSDALGLAVTAAGLLDGAAERAAGRLDIRWTVYVRADGDPAGFLWFLRPSSRGSLARSCVGVSVR